MSHTQQADFSDDVSLLVLIEQLENSLSTQSNSQRFLTGQVNFCTLMPMRSIPFKVVCLLGMNDGQYPRSIVPMGFDLMAGHRNRGDRSRRDEDRYLFLEALLSAKDRLYISYIGRNINDNSEKMPSVLVAELLNYCQQSFVLCDDISAQCDLAEQALLAFIRHDYPMQSFSASYFLGDVKTYNQSWWKALQSDQPMNVGIQDQLPLDTPLLEVQLQHLMQFLKHPCKAFFNQRLSVYFELDRSEQDNDEPFGLDNLQRYFLKHQQFEYALEGKPLDTLFTQIKAQGELPLGEFAPLIFDKDKQSMCQLAEIASSYFVDEMETISIDIRFGDKRLLGELTDHCENGLVRVKTGNIKGKDILSLWVEHLCYCIAHGEQLNSTLFGQADGIYFEEFPSDYAYQKLAELIALYEQGLQSPLPFFIESAYAWALAANKSEPECYVLDDLNFETRAEAQTAALAVFANSRGFSEGSDPYIQTLLR